MSRPIAYDITHLVSRLLVPSPTGIDRVDLAYAKHFAARDPSHTIALHCGLRQPHLLRSVDINKLAQVTESNWREDQNLALDNSYQRVLRWLRSPAEPRAAEREPRHDRTFTERLGRYQMQLRYRTRWDGASEIPSGTIYVNVAQHLLDVPRFYRWLDERRDLQKVFVLQDLLPLQFPEYFKPGYKAVFDGCVDLIARYASAVIVTTTDVKNLVQEDFARRGRGNVPVVAMPLPSPLGGSATSLDSELLATPYFVTTGTIEPRKNHLLLLTLWRKLAQRNSRAPQLIIVGKRGWENEQVIDLLERCEQLQPYVIETSNLSSAGLRNLIQHSCGVLCPSFGEGYGLPLVEGLSLGVPVVASDIPVFREVGQGCAEYRSPLDGEAWGEVIQSLADRTSEYARVARRRASAFIPPTWQNYFEQVDLFLANL